MTKRFLRIWALALALTASLSFLCEAVPAETASGTRIGPCIALRAIDADSVDLQCGARALGVRLRNVAAPRPGQVGYGEANRALSELVRARALYVVPETPGELPLDPSGRVLAYLVDRSGANLNVAFVLWGWATYSEDPGPSHLADSFRSAQASARTDQRALWTVWSATAEGAPPR
ncbi:MAG TPA: thermonuclease family protein [Myxococcota bacterium]|nr:thermonuclease family protein [Myxococcota bacterium]